MKQLVSVRSNCYFTIPEDGKSFSINPSLELIIIHTDGKDYKLKKDNSIQTEVKLVESRFLVSPESLSQLITDLQLHQTKLDTVRKNGDQLNALIQHISTSETKPQE